MARLEGKVNNQPIAASIVAAFEAFALGAKAGLEPDTMVQLVNAGTGRSFANSEIMPALLSSRFGATISMMDKDVALGLEEARAQNMPMWTIEQAGRVRRFAASQRAAGQDLSELARLTERWAGDDIRSRPED